MISIQWITDHLALLAQFGAVLSIIALLLNVLARIAGAIGLNRLAHGLTAVAAALPEFLRVSSNVVSAVTNKPFVIPTETTNTPPSDAPRVAIKPPPLPILLMLAILAISCSASAAHTAGVVTVVSAGSITRGMFESSRALYTDATDALRARVQGAAYDTAVVPIDAAFLRRGHALGLLDSALYEGARIVDAHTIGAGVQPVLTMIRDALTELSAGDVLPSLPIPPEITALVTALESLAGGAQ